MATSFTSTARYFMELKKMPRTYHFCTGTAPTENGPLEAKCDEDNKQFETESGMIYTCIFFVFTIAVCYENIKQRQTSTALQENHEPIHCDITQSRTIFIDIIGFIIKMVNALLGMFATLAYHDMDMDKLATFPGSLIFYYFHLWLFPVATIAEKMRRFWVDRGLRNYLRRFISNI